MKKLLKKSLVLLVILSLVASSFVAFAKSDKKNGEKVTLYEKYGYNEDFEYDDTTIAYALKSAVVLIYFDYMAEIEYTQASVDVEEIKAEIEAQYAELSDYYTEEEFAELVAEDMVYNIDDYLDWGDTKTVPVNLGWRGSGVVIDEYGYVATNSHVASISDEEKYEACMDYLYMGIAEDLDQIVEDLWEYDIPLSYDMMDAVYYAALEEVSETAVLIDEESVLSVCFPSASGETFIDEDRTYEAELVENGVSLTVSNDGTTQDAAIIKIEKDGLVALKISESYPDVNSKIVSAGFPADADSIFAYEMGSDQSTLSVTIGTGNIARLIPIDGHDYKALEITTTIRGGNSGGPSVDSKLEIEGLNTYGTYDGSYAYMVPAEYVKELADQFDVSQDEVTYTFLTGLQMLQQGYGAAALECFEEVEKMNGDVPYIKELIAKAEDAPQEYPESTESAKTSKGIDFKLIAIIAGAVLGVIVIVVVIILVVKSKKRKKAAHTVPETYDIRSFGGGTPPSSDPAPYGSVPPASGFGGFGAPQQNQGSNSGFGSVPPAPNPGSMPQGNINNPGFNQVNSYAPPSSSAPSPSAGAPYGGTPVGAPPTPAEPKSNPTSGKFVGKFNFGGTTPGFVNNKEDDK